MCARPGEIEVCANTVTVCSRMACRVTASAGRSGFHSSIGAAPQNFASVVSVGVRVVLVVWPRLLNLVERPGHSGALVIGGGGAGRNGRPAAEHERVTEPQS